MNGHEFEYRCADILRRKGYHNVVVTKASGDQGVDITAYKGLVKYAVQCKYYSSPVGNKAVQEVYAGGKYYDCDRYIVMTNNTFTKSAKEAAKKLDVQLWENCSPSGSKGFSFKVMRIISIFNILIGGLSIAFAPSYPSVVVSNYICGIDLILAGILGWVGWGYAISNLVTSLLYLLITMIMGISSVIQSTFDLSDIILVIPALIYFVHARHLKPKLYNTTHL